MCGSFGGVPCPAPGVGNRTWAIHMIGLNPSGMDGCVDPHAACRQTLKLGTQVDGSATGQLKGSTLLGSSGRVASDGMSIPGSWRNLQLSTITSSHATLPPSEQEAPANSQIRPSENYSSRCRRRLLSSSGKSARKRS